MKTKICIILSFFVLLAMNLPAVEIITDEDYKTEDRIVESDYIFLGKDLSFSGETEDLFFIGKNLSFTGKSKFGIFSLGRIISIAGDAGNGVFSAGQDIIIDGKIESTTFLAGEEITFNKNSHLNGALFAAGKEIRLSGPVEGDVYLAAGEVIIDNIINGNVIAHSGKLTITENGKINGDLLYTCDKALSEKDLSKISGSVNLDKSISGFFDEEDDMPSKSEIADFFHVLALIIQGVLFFCGIILLFIPFTKNLEVSRNPKEIFNHALFGLVPLLIYPAAIILLFILVVTSPLAFMLMLLWIPVHFITKLVGTIMLGQLIFGIAGRKTTNRFISFLLGSIICILLSFVPFMGFLTYLFVSCLGWGYFTVMIFRKKRYEF